MHFGTSSPPRGEAHYAYKSGEYTVEALALRAQAAKVLKAVRENSL